MRQRTSRVIYQAIIGLGVFALGGWLVHYFVGLRNLGYIDSAIFTMRTLLAAEDKFAKAHPGLGYTCSLTDIATNPTMASGRWNEYVFEISGCRAKSAGGPNIGYFLTAHSLRSAMPAFCSDQSGILRYDSSGSAVSCTKSGHPL